MPCLFCQIIQHEIPATTIYEDEYVLAFHDIAPQAPVHLLLIPRKHIATLNDLEPNDAQLMGHIVYVAATVAKQLDVAQAGYRLISNCNHAGGQTVFHIHFHLLAGRCLHWPPG